MQIASRSIIRAHHETALQQKEHLDLEWLTHLMRQSRHPVWQLGSQRDRPEGTGKRAVEPGGHHGQNRVQIHRDYLEHEEAAQHLPRAGQAETLICGGILRHRL